MTPEERAEIEATAEQVCPHTYRGLPCEQPAGHRSRHWSRPVHGQSVNWPDEMSDRSVQQAAS